MKCITGESGIYKIKRPGKDDADGRICCAFETGMVSGSLNIYLWIHRIITRWEKQVLEFLADTTLLADDGIIIVEASKETDLSYARRTGLFHNKRKDI